MNTYMQTLTADQQAMIREAADTLERAYLRGPEITSPHAMSGLLKLKLGALPHEVFTVVFLNTRHRIMAIEEMFRGTIDGATVHPREVAKRALELNAAAVILAHNHPSGTPDPSRQDIALTRRLGQALALLDIRVLDHFVIGEGEPVSMAELGLYTAPSTSS